MQLHEQYRPRAWHEVIGQDKVIQRIEGLKARSLTGRNRRRIGMVVGVGSLRGWT